MRSSLFALLVIVIFQVNAPGQSKTSKEIDGLVGPVHTVTTVTVTLSLLDGVWIEGKRSAPSLITYDETGNDGRFNIGPQSELAAPGDRKYDDKGHLIEVTYRGPDNVVVGKMLFTYDQAGRQTEIVHRHADGKLIRRDAFTFDDKGNMTSVSTFDAADQLARKVTWTFDEKGNRTEWTESLAKGREMVLFEKLIDTYDDEGNLLTETQYGNPEGSVVRQSFSYEFDLRGNWIRRERAFSYGDSTEIASKDVALRAIAYYEKTNGQSPP